MRKDIKVKLANDEYISICKPNVEVKFLPETGIVDIRRTYDDGYYSLYTIPTDNIVYIDWGNDE